MDCFNLTPLKLQFYSWVEFFWFCKAAGGLIRKHFPQRLSNLLTKKNNMHKVLPLPLVVMCSTVCFPTIWIQIKKYFVSQGSLWAAWEGRPPRAPESIAQVQCDEEADDECHCAAQRAGICGAAGIANCSGDHFIFSFVSLQSVNLFTASKVKFQNDWSSYNSNTCP